MRLYVHVPFCNFKCYYCNFYSVLGTEKQAEYVEALRKEYDIRARQFEKFDSIYIGGGTPSALDPTFLDALLGIFSEKNTGEFTVEMNPETVTAERLDILKKHGVNRISLGVQSSDNKILEDIGRQHSYEDVGEKLALLCDKGFSNLSLDFISGFAGQSEQDVEGFVNLVRQWNIPHVSAYALMYSGKKLAVLDDDEERALFYYLLERLVELGFSRYEVSSFAKKGYESRHNSAYWNRDYYVGLGPAASSFLGYRVGKVEGGMGDGRDDEGKSACAVTLKDMSSSNDVVYEFRMTNISNLNKYISFYEKFPFDQYKREKKEQNISVQNDPFIIDNPFSESNDESPSVAEIGTETASVSESGVEGFLGTEFCSDKSRVMVLKTTDGVTNQTKDRKNKSIVNSFLTRYFSEVADIEELSVLDAAIEDIILPLRTAKGLDVGTYYQKYGVHLLSLPSVQWLLEQAFLRVVGGEQCAEDHLTLALTKKGYDLSNSVYVKMIEEVEPYFDEI